ncbi:grainyhead-like protein 2 homolog [Archocentrus centrarchus]|uniref:grainyhead-like protein 2 homolog n=1 Tax=Archocentrus centrarchus TaxID=63155 RepID=UPI0011EA0247|nr:grainyhead-like protein 2 homolog [Archocentrus centrarchus]
MDLDSKRLVVVVPNEVSVASRRPLSSEDEAWKIFLENPLTAATKAMMSINGDEDSAAALGVLYDYYRVPREKRHTPSAVKPTEPSANGSSNCGKLDTLDQQFQAMVSMPVNLSLNNSTTTEHQQGFKYGAENFAGDSRGDGKGGGNAPLALVKTEGHTCMSRSFSGGACQQEPGEQIRRLYEQSSYDLSLTGYLRDEQRSSPDSTYEEPVEKEMSHKSSSSAVDEFHHSLPAGSFLYNLEATMSLRPRQGEGPMAYLNRGQFYALTLSAAGFRSSLRQPRGKVGVTGGTASRGADGSPSGNDQCATGGSELPPNSIVQSVIMVVFGEDKGRDEQLKNWKYWHSRQHTAKQRVLDIADYKESFNTIGNVEEIAYNAVSFTWDVSEEAKVFISVNCLSTDFSSQKGVKGMPLIIQIDTYSYNNSCSSRPIHRAFTQIKAFCDKGAERKLRDEEKKQLRKSMKGKNGRSGPTTLIKRAAFRSMVDLDSQPVLFIPDIHFGNLQRAGQVFAFNTEEADRSGSVLMKRVSCVGQEDLCSSPLKKPKAEPERKVLLYVRKECDEVFDALMLRSPTLKALMEAISEKYAVPVDKIAKVYQKSKKGLLVNMDDNIIQHYSNEDTFILAIESSADCLRVTLSEI